MSKYIKKTFREKAINRIERRLNTKSAKSINLRFQGRQEIINVLDANFDDINAENINEIVDAMVSGAEYINRSNAKRIKKDLNLRKISDVQRLSNKELGRTVTSLFDLGEDIIALEVLQAYGY